MKKNTHTYYQYHQFIKRTNLVMFMNLEVILFCFKFRVDLSLIFFCLKFKGYLTRWYG